MQSGHAEDTASPVREEFAESAVSFPCRINLDIIPQALSADVCVGSQGLLFTHQGLKTRGNDMRPKLRLTNDNKPNEQPDQSSNPAPISFQKAKQEQSLGFPFFSTEHRMDDVLRSLDNLSTTLEDLRKEIDTLDDDNTPTPAA